jgi:hypothetical protein
MAALPNLVNWPATCLDDAHALGSYLGAVPEVERVYVASRGEVVFVWTVTSDFRRVVRNEIYRIEQKLFEEFPDIEFDFNVVESSEDAYPENALSDAVLVYAREAR